MRRGHPFLVDDTIAELLGRHAETVGTLIPGQSGKRFELVVELGQQAFGPFDVHASKFLYFFRI